ncbi:MAG: hypothetical protein ACTSXP_08465, partial [Promethearchaeota archaeon]
MRLSKKNRQSVITRGIIIIGIIMLLIPGFFLLMRSTKNNLNDGSEQAASDTHRNGIDIFKPGPMLDGDISKSEVFAEIDNSSGGYSSASVGDFSVVENATSTHYTREFQAVEGNYYNVSTPAGWNSSTMHFDIESYSKEQKLDDPAFNAPINVYWKEDIDTSEDGDIIKSIINIYGNNIASTSVFYDGGGSGDAGFTQGDFGYWRHKNNFLNPSGLGIQKGRVYQDNNVTTEDYGLFTKNPNFYKDLDMPYGGFLGTDDLYLAWEAVTASLVVDITPGIGIEGGNPSAAWWYYYDFPYEPDSVEITISWEIDPDSTFEASDSYCVIARINDQYIDGRTWINRSDNLPYNGTATALIEYDDSGHLDHSVISRTYNITDLIDGIGINKFDFGVWAKNPTHSGDNDEIIARFHTIKIHYRTARKYEIASFRFDYACINNNPFSNIGTPDPDSFVNKLSIVLEIKNDSGISETFRIIPYTNLIMSPSIGPGGIIFNTLNFSISQEYIYFLNSSQLEFKFGVLFERDYFDDIDVEFYFDNVYFWINYKHPTVLFSGLEIKLDDNDWNPLVANSFDLNVSTWIGGGEHVFQFRTRSLQYLNNLYINFDARLDLYFYTPKSNGAPAGYSISSANSEFGIWNVTFDNSRGYVNLTQENLSATLNLTSYSISYLDLPAHDGLGGNSTDWNVTRAFSPSGKNYSRELVRVDNSANNFLQICIIENAFEQGNWTIYGLQPNYISNISLNHSFTYLDKPGFYCGNTLEYNLTLINTTATGNYSILVYNSNYSLVSGYEFYNSSINTTIIGKFLIQENFTPGLYYLVGLWNDSVSNPENPSRFGSIVKTTYVFINTTAELFNPDQTVNSGEIANFTLNYSNVNGSGITNATIIVYENSTGIPRLWGRAWTGSYQVAGIVYEGNGNYTVSLNTTGAPNGTYPLIFYLNKLFYRHQILFGNLTVITIQYLNVTITTGATWNSMIGQYVLDPGNHPYVNDTVNSIIQVNLTDAASNGTPVLGAFVVGVINDSENYMIATEIGNGLYNLTLNATGFNATMPGENLTLSLVCSATGFNPE